MGSNGVGKLECIQDTIDKYGYLNFVKTNLKESDGIRQHTICSKKMLKNSLKKEWVKIMQY